MAHPRIIAQKRAIALDRLMVSATKLAKRHGLQEQLKLLEGAKSHDAGMTQMLQTEALAGLLEALDKSTKASAKPTKDDTQELDAVGPVTVETVEEKPLVTTETVEYVETGASTVIGKPKAAKGDKNAS